MHFNARTRQKRKSAGYEPETSTIRGSQTQVRRGSRRRLARVVEPGRLDTVSCVHQVARLKFREQRAPVGSRTWRLGGKCQRLVRGPRPSDGRYPSRRRACPSPARRSSTCFLLGAPSFTGCAVFEQRDESGKKILSADDNEGQAAPSAKNVSNAKCLCDVTPRDVVISWFTSPYK